MATISLSFQSSTLLFINLTNSLLIVFLLMLRLFRMLFQMRFVPLSPWPLLESSLKPTCTPKRTHISLIISWCFLWCLAPFLSLDTEIWSTAFLLFCCTLEFSCMGRLSTVKVELELEVYLFVFVWGIAHLSCTNLFKR